MLCNDVIKYKYVFLKPQRREPVEIGTGLYLRQNYAQCSKNIQWIIVQLQDFETSNPYTKCNTIKLQMLTSTFSHP